MPTCIVEYRDKCRQMQHLVTLLVTGFTFGAFVVQVDDDRFICLVKCTNNGLLYSTILQYKLYANASMFYSRFVLDFYTLYANASMALQVCFILCMQMPPWLYRFVLYFVCKCLHGSTGLFYTLYANASMALQVCFILCMQMPPWLYRFVLYFVCKCLHGSTGLFYTLYANASMALWQVCFTPNCWSSLAISKSHSLSDLTFVASQQPKHGWGQKQTTNITCGPVTLLPKTVLFYIKHSWYPKYQQNTN